MKYQVIIKVEFEAMDDIEARTVAESITTDNNILEVYEEKATYKIQEVFENKPPRGISIK